MKGLLTKFFRRGKKVRNGFGKRKKHAFAGFGGMTKDGKTLSDHGKFKLAMRQRKFEASQKPRIGVAE